MLLPGTAADAVDEHGHAVEGATLLLAPNAGEKRLRFALPALGPGRWRQILNSVCLDARTLRGATLVAPERSLTLLEFRAAA